MHPARSIILFTVLNGLGFGLLLFLGLGIPAVTGWVAFVFFAIAYILGVGGLLASLFHLGHPERFLKALTQWRSSWLSREGLLAIATLAVMAVYGAGLVFLDTRWVILGWIGAGLAAGTVYATSMIYAQMRSVPRWHHWSTSALFLMHALAGGALLAGQVQVAGIALLALGAIQFWVWIDGDGRFARAGSTLATATGLGGPGAKLRLLEPPHTGRNYLLTEMVHEVGRKHAVKLRIIALAAASVVPALLLLLLPVGHGLALLVVVLHLVGALAARWLFFAEAEHVVGLYYGKHAPESFRNLA